MRAGKSRETTRPVSAQQTSTHPHVSKNPPAVNETRIRVRYAETDQMGVAYHANHFIWFEVGRVELLRQFGFSYRDMEREDDCFMMTRSSCART